MKPHVNAITRTLRKPRTTTISLCYIINHSTQYKKTCSED